MATAEELLTASANIGDDYLLIDNEFRTIIIPDNLKYLGVANDKDVLKLKFKMPRYFSDTDLSKFSIRVNYSNAKEERDSYTVKDVVVGSDFITFSWLVGRVATKIKGATEFSVCAIMLDDEGNVDKEFNTSPVNLEVLEGLVANARTVTLYSDVIEQWRQELFGIGDTEEANMIAVSEAQQTAIEEKGAEVLATIPEDYTTTHSMANESVRSKADAIICYSEGDAITVSDSSDDYLRGLSIYGKTSQIRTTGVQLFDASKVVSTKSGGVTLVNNGDGSFTITGDTISGNAFGAYHDYTHEEMSNMLKAGALTLAANRTSYPYVYAMLRKSNVNQSVISNSTRLTHAMTITDEHLSNEEYTLRIGFYGELDRTISNGAIVRPMLYQDGDGTWEAYSGGYTSPSPEWPQDLVNIANDGTTTLTLCGANLFDEQTILGYWSSTTGTFVSASDQISSVNYISIPQVFYIAAPTSVIDIVFYDRDKNFILSRTLSDLSDAIEAPDGACYIHINLKTGYGTEYNYDVCVSATLTEYETHSTYQTLTVSTPNGLPGIPVSSGGNYTDSDGQQWICDEVDFENGVYAKRVASIDMYDYVANVSLADNTSYSDAIVRFDIGYVLGSRTNTPVFCDHFQYRYAHAADNTVVRATECVSSHSTSDVISVFIDKTRLAGTTLDDVCEWLSDNRPTLVYALATPIETALTADEIAAFQTLKSNYPNTTVINDAGAGLGLGYNADTQTWINNLIDAKIAAALANLQ